MNKWQIQKLKTAIKEPVPVILPTTKALKRYSRGDSDKFNPILVLNLLLYCTRHLTPIFDL